MQWAARSSPSDSICSRNARSSMSSNTFIPMSSTSTASSASRWDLRPCFPDPPCAPRIWRMWPAVHLIMPRRVVRSAEPEQAQTSFFSTFLPLYLDFLAVEKGLAANSRKSYQRDLHHFGEFLAKKKIECADVRRVDLIRYFQSLRGAGLSARSTARALAAIRGDRKSTRLNSSHSQI